MINLKNANEIRQISVSAKYNYFSYDYIIIINEIAELIESAAAKGLLHIYYNKPIHDDIISYLELNNYIVRNNNTCYDTYNSNYTISWHKNN